MLDRGHDQAAGLRRIVDAQPALNLMAFPVADDGREHWIAPLAGALRRLGARPVVIDASRGRLMQAFGLKPRHDLLDLLKGAKDFDGVAQCTADGVYVMRADRGVEAFVGSGAPALQLFTGFARLSHRFDAILLAMPAHELACLAPPAQAVPVIALEEGEPGLTRAYGTLKQLSTDFGYTRFAVVIQGPREPASRPFAADRLATVAREFPKVEVSVAGRLPLPGADASATLADLAQTLLHSAAMPLALH